MRLTQTKQNNMEKINSKSNFELISDSLSTLSQQIPILIIQKGCTWIEQKLKDQQNIVQNNLNDELINQEEFEVLMFEIDRIRSNPIFNLVSKSSLQVPEPK
jgi:hypothetical protein